METIPLRSERYLFLCNVVDRLHGEDSMEYYSMNHCIVLNAPPSVVAARIAEASVQYKETIDLLFEGDAHEMSTVGVVSGMLPRELGNSPTKDNVVDLFLSAAAAGVHSLFSAKDKGKKVLCGSANVEVDVAAHNKGNKFLGGVSDHGISAKDKGKKVLNAVPDLDKLPAADIQALLIEKKSNVKAMNIECKALKAKLKECKKKQQEVIDLADEEVIDLTVKSPVLETGESSSQLTWVMLKKGPLNFTLKRVCKSCFVPPKK